ncbi:hypothetical protein NG796_13090 [Laspinema sp. A4]|nr:hypothetical protein [Laspinema sp. D2d]MCT7984231.1 hypothetical protein [Laspinema sp. D2d]
MGIVTGDRRSPVQNPIPYPVGRSGPSQGAQAQGKRAVRSQPGDTFY